VSRVFKKRPVTLDELKANIREAIHNVLQRLMDEFTKRLQECSTAEGGYFLHFLKSEYCMHQTLFTRFL
jgi:predicted RNase H-like HicB family nuclease